MATQPAWSQLLNLHLHIREGVFFLGLELVPKFLRAAAEFPSLWESPNKFWGHPFLVFRGQDGGRLLPRIPL